MKLPSLKFDIRAPSPHLKNSPRDIVNRVMGMRELEAEPDATEFMNQDVAEDEDEQMNALRGHD